MPVRDIALPHEFLGHGRRADVLTGAGLSAQEIAREVVEAAAKVAVDPVAQR